MNLLVPMDMDETSKHALQEAITLAKSFKEQGKITILHVINREIAPDAVETTVDLESKLHEETNAYLTKVKHIVEKANLAVEIVALEGFAATKILDFEKKNPVDFIVIGHHNRKGLDRIVVGSVSKKIIHDAACPVIVVK